MELSIKADSGSRFILRSLEHDDYHKGFLKLLEQLTIVGEVSKEVFDERMEQKLNDGHYVAIIEDTEVGLVVATGSIYIEKKFGHNCSKVGHIEDVVVDQNFRGQHLGQRVIDFLVELARSSSCYKIYMLKEKIQAFLKEQTHQEVFNLQFWWFVSINLWSFLSSEVFCCYDPAPARVLVLALNLLLALKFPCSR